MEPRTAQIVSNAYEFVQTALSRAGITDNFLAELAREGMSAFNQKIITDQNGNIIDVVNMPDWRNRHAFWRDILMAKKILGSELTANVQAGGLFIFSNDAGRMVSSHPPACTCDDCIKAWEEKSRQLRRISENAAAIDTTAETVETQAENAETTSNGIDEESEDFSDR